MKFDVHYLDHMGSDYGIYYAAKMSTGGAKSKEEVTQEEVRKMIQNLIQWGHTSPFEQGVIQMELEMSIYVMRQFVRHRMASMIERSLRYTEMNSLPDNLECEEIRWAKERETTIKDEKHYLEIMQKICTIYNSSIRNSMDSYKQLLDLGLHREQARGVIPLAGKTKCVWSIDVRNLLRFFRLRIDSHAQKEIRDLSDAIFMCVYPYFPITMDVFRNATKEERAKF